MSELVDGIGRLAGGDYSVKLPENNKSFVSPISKSINKLSLELEKNYQK